MSYEGYTQYLCKNGHTWSRDCMEEESKVYDCGWRGCGAPVVWWNMVNNTNGCEPVKGDPRDLRNIHKKPDDCTCGYITLEKIHEQRCEKCDHVLEQRFKIPKKGGQNL